MSFLFYGRYTLLVSIDNDDDEDDDDPDSQRRTNEKQSVNHGPIHRPCTMHANTFDIRDKANTPSTADAATFKG
jgi:hypothetical protein